MKSFKEIKFKELIFNNFPLKILSVFLAVVLWVVIANIDNPSARKTMSGITVNVKNGENLESMGYIYQVESGGTIALRVKAPRSVLNELKSTDFDVYADLSERATNSDKVKIHVECNKSDIENQIDIISVTPEYLQISIDNMVSKELQLSLNVTGEPDKGFVIGDYYTSPGTVRISGAASVVDEITAAGVHYDVESMKTNVDDTVAPVFYDSDGNEVDVSKLEISRNNVKIHIDILPTKWVPVHYAVTGAPAEGYQVTGYSANMESVNIAASSENLDKISSVDIPAGTIDFTGLTDNKVFEVALASYLPTGYRIVSSESTLRVTAEVQQNIEKNVSLDVADIKVNNLDDGMKCTIQNTGGENSVNVTIRGLRENVDEVDSKVLGASVSLEGRKKGSYVILVTFAGSDKYEVVGNYYVNVNIMDETETSADNETSLNESKSEDETAKETVTEGAAQTTEASETAGSTEK